jgi:uncharacterized protein with PIN domain
VSPEQIALFEAKRKAEQAQTKAEYEKYTTFIQQQKTQNDTYWAAKQANLKIATPQTEQTCPLCNGKIPAFTRAKYAVKQATSSSGFGLKRVYYCVNCRPLNKPTVEAKPT